MLSNIADLDNSLISNLYKIPQISDIEFLYISYLCFTASSVLHISEIRDFRIKTLGARCSAARCSSENKIS